MGEAKRRAEAYKLAKDALMATLAGHERTVADSAIALFEGFVLPKRYVGGCYLTTMFLHRFLADEHGIATTPVVGYVNDGTDDIFMSHAWLDVAGRKVDLTLHLTEHQGVQLPGALLVLDHVLRPGQVSHSYYFEMSPAAEVANAIIAQDPRGAFILRHKEQEHHEMALRAADPVLMADYLAKAPAEFGYAAMRAALG